MMTTEKDTNIASLPMLALRGLVLFPGMLLHFDVGRKKSIEALNSAMSGNRSIFLITQRDIMEDDPRFEELYTIGCVAKVRQLLKLPGDNVRALVEGVQRAELLATNDGGDCQQADVLLLKDSKYRCGEAHRQALIRRVRSLFEEYAKAAPKVAPDVIMSVMATDDLGKLSDFIVSNIPAETDDKQYILEQLSPLKRIKLVTELLVRENQILGIDAKINAKVHEQMDENQREYYLREQMKVIGEELYGEDNPYREAEEYADRVETLKAPKEVRDKLLSEVGRFAKMPTGSHEAAVIRTYLDTCLELPWGVYTKSKINITRARKILDRDHYGMDKVKERIIELLAVRSLAGDLKGQIICLVGPPGVGKTSIAKAIAECTGRQFARVSLGGISDESEIRGHRKTYIGAMPGRIIDAVRTAKSSNPLILLDEIDKISQSYHGDPSSALLETLDSEQNSTFKDHYIDLPFDLSRVLFVTTANTTDTIHGPLLDRMEVIQLSSYTRQDKFEIARRHLVPEQLKLHGLKSSTCRIADDAIFGIIDYYTREAGVRRLKRVIATLCRKAAADIVTGKRKSVRIAEKDLEGYLGPRKYRTEQLPERDEVGLVNGLAWTSVGGELMQLEVAAVEGTGKLELTGSLGDVMKESARAAVTYVRSRADSLGIDPGFYKNRDIHIHATETAVPKDGPSAGITITVALVSALTGRPVDRTVAMTGEISILGRVTAIGGLKEKTMAAYRAGIKTVFLPEENRSDIAEIDPVVKSGIKFVCVSSADDVIERAIGVAPEQKNRAEYTSRRENVHSARISQ